MGHIMELIDHYLLSDEGRPVRAGTSNQKAYTVILNLSSLM